MKIYILHSHLALKKENWKSLKHKHLISILIVTLFRAMVAKRVEFNVIVIIKYDLYKSVSKRSRGTPKLHLNN